MERPCVFDAHCDTISRCWREYEDLDRNSGAVDLERTERSFSHYAQIFALWTSQGYTGGNTVEEAYHALLRCFQRQIERSQDRICLCRTGADIRRAWALGKAAALLSVEGAGLLGCDPNRLEQVARDGVRVITLTWNHANALSGSHSDHPERGLSGQGRRFVRRMEELNILVDVSHLSEAGFWDVMALARHPVLATHSNAKSVWNHTRNLTDGQITAIIKNQGVMGLNFYREFVGLGQNLDSVRAHLDRILELGGGENVALGGDWDGCDTIPDLPDVGALDRFYEYLLCHHYNEMVVRGLFYNNLMRVVSLP